MFNTAAHQGNAHRNHSKLSLHTCYNGYYQREVQGLVRVQEKKKGSCVVSQECQLLWSLWKSYEDSSQIKTTTTM